MYCYKRLFSTLPAFFFLNFLYVTCRILCLALFLFLWFWERLKAGGGGDNRGWDGWMTSPTQWTWVWVGSGSWVMDREPGMLQSMELQRAGHNWATELKQRQPLKDRCLTISDCNIGSSERHSNFKSVKT